MILVSLLIALWHPGVQNPFWQGIEGHLLDARFLWRGPVSPPDEIVIVAFDDAAVSRLDAFPPPRSALATAVSEAGDAGAKAIALDFLLVEARPGDAELARALSGMDSVLGVAESSVDAPLRDFDAGGFAVVVASRPGDPLPVLGPAEALRGVSHLGHVIVRHDADGAVRRLDAARALATRAGVAWYPSLALASLKAADEALDVRLLQARTGSRLAVGQTSVPLDRQDAIPLVFYGPQGTIPTYSLSSVEDADLAGRIVFLGATATGFGDRHATAFDAALPGVELHATLAANLIEGRHLRRDAVAWIWDALFAVVATALGFAAAAGLDRPWLVAVAVGSIVLATTVALQAAFLFGWWLDGSTIFLSLLLGVGSGAALHLLEYRRRAANLSLYHSPLFVDRLASFANPRFGTEAQPAVVLFVDVENFTGYSERLGPEGTADFLRLFHEVVEQAVDPLGGTIAHFAGDGAIVVFGLPKPDPNDAVQAVLFIEKLYASVRSNSVWPGLELRVGGHMGPVQTAVVGGKRHRQLTVSGDVVNTASRLQDFAKACNASVALSGTLLRSSPQALSWAEEKGLRSSGEHKLRGRLSPIEVWTGPAP